MAASPLLAVALGRVSIFITYFTAWFVVARNLKSLVRNSFGVQQAFLVLIVTVAALMQSTV